jgi:hypothetical protein
MTFSEAQVYVFAVIVGAAVGLYRGWSREAITMAIELATVLFLLLGGVVAVAHLFTTTSSALLPVASAHGLSGGGPTGPPAQTTAGASSSDTQICTNGISARFVGECVFAVMTWVAYHFGHKYGGPPQTNMNRVTGMLPGAVNGGAIMLYLSTTIFNGREITIFSPSGPAATNYLPLVLGLALLCVVGVLVLTKKAAH